MSPQDAVFKAKLFVDSIRKSGVKLSGAYMFGSFATGTPRLGSDIDVCVVSPQFGKDPMVEAVTLAKLADKVDMMIEVHPMGEEDFSDKYNHLAYEVKTHGVSILN